ncbi:T9SS type A sorting domain-containing protein [Flavobacterium sp.]|uniref:T9SS type A sorting domain-containing protein n=1 Tax=Flavobacterium sp. TaxID=239 RepID=UPI00375145AA
MKKLLLFTLLLYNLSFSQSTSFQKTWATYYGDENVVVNDAVIDNAGNIYLVGVTNNNNSFDSTDDAHQTQFGGGSADGFISKISPTGQLLWATFFGGSDVDIIESITIDRFNNIFISGYTSSQNQIATLNSFQSSLNGVVNSFFAKILIDGSVEWSTYYLSNITTNIGDGEITIGNNLLSYSGLTCDNNGNLYLFTLSENESEATSGTFQTQRNSSKYLISKFNPLGQRLWATYYGINLSEITAICVNETGLYVTGRGLDCVNGDEIVNTYFATPNCFQADGGSGCYTSYLTKFNLEGQRVWSTYFGNQGENTNLDDYALKNSLKCFENSIYIGITAGRDVGIATIGSFQETKNYLYSGGLLKFDSDGNKIWGTYYGLNQYDNSNAITVNLAIDKQGNPYLGGTTNFLNNIATTGCYQNNLIYNLNNPYFNYDSFAAKFNANGERIWGTYFGGTEFETSANLLTNGTYFYLVGLTESTSNISTNGAYQTSFINSNNTQINPKNNSYIARFDPLELSTNTFNSNSFSIYPNPNNGNFTLSINNDSFEKATLIMYDVLGKKILNQDLFTKETIIKTHNLSKGVYFAKITTSDNEVFTKKIVVE